MIRWWRSLLNTTLLSSYSQDCHSTSPDLRATHIFLLFLPHSASPPLTKYFPSPNTSLLCPLHSISFPFLFSTGDQINQISSGRHLMNAMPDFHNTLIISSIRNIWGQHSYCLDCFFGTAQSLMPGMS